MNLKSIFLGAAATLPMMMASAAPTHGIDRTNLDPAVNPAEDFYLYACGGWMKNHPLSPEYSRFGTFDLLRENAREQLQELIKGLDQNPDSKVAGTNAQKVRDLYALGMDSVRLNKEGAAPLQPVLREIENYKPGDLAGLLGKTHMVEGGSFLSSGVGANPKNSDMNMLHLGEAGLGLGDRDYYLESNETNDKILAAYRNYITTIMKLAGYDETAAQRISDNVVKLETEWAKNKMSREERRNPLLRSNPRTLDELKAEFPNFDWEGYFKALEIPMPENVNISGLNYLKSFNEAIPSLQWQEVVDYLLFDTVAGATGLLSDDFYDASFDLYDRLMSGKQEQEARWKRAMAIPNSMFGEAVGELYVAKYFPEENKQYMKTLVENLRGALGKHIANLSWMSDETKAKAQDKLDGFTVKIGYPDKWKDYSGITIDPSKSYFENVLEAAKWYNRDNYSKMNEPVDKEKWLMTPQTVNAYYMPSTNEICFPAAILQPPYFDPSADDAMNYGAIGVVIGHEMTHGFDDSGRQYDKQGNLNDWWLPTDAEAFKALSEKLVDQFDQVEVAPGVNANGRFTLGENIADQGGLRVAMTAYKDNFPEAGVVDGFTPEQRFYLAYANLWAGNIRDEEILQRTKTDPHSLGNNRVNVTVRNLEPFFQAFGVKEGDKMFRPVEERVIIW